MKRTVTGFCVAAAFGCIATLGAQTSTTPTTADQRAPMADKARDVTITGCLSKAADGQFTLTNARIENPTGAPSSSTTAGTSTTTAGTTTAGTTAGTTTSTTASTQGAMNSAAATAWMLAGGSDLDKHVGHKIQVTGRTAWDNAMDRSRTPDTTTSATGTPASTVGTSGTTATASTEGQRKDMRADQPRLEVQSIKMIAPSCS
jgi:hypothetical protein